MQCKLFLSMRNDQEMYVVQDAPGKITRGKKLGIREYSKTIKIENVKYRVP